MVIRKFSDRLWRIYIGEVSRDIWFKEGLLLPPCGKANQLTDEELAFVEAEIKRNK